MGDGLPPDLVQLRPILPIQTLEDSWVEKTASYAEPLLSTCLAGTVPTTGYMLAKLERIRPNEFQKVSVVTSNG